LSRYTYQIYKEIGMYTYHTARRRLFTAVLVAAPTAIAIVNHNLLHTERQTSYALRQELESQSGERSISLLLRVKNPKLGVLYADALARAFLAAAKSENVSILLLLAIAEEESGFDQFAISDKGAIGIMQVMPLWTGELAFIQNAADLFSLDINVRAGAFIFKQYLAKCGDLSAALRCYHGGERALRAPRALTLLYVEGVKRTYNRNLSM
jgi:hypothetical protein